MTVQNVAELHKKIKYHNTNNAKIPTKLLSTKLTFSCQNYTFHSVRLPFIHDQALDMLVEAGYGQQLVTSTTILLNNLLHSYWPNLTSIAMDNSILIKLSQVHGPCSVELCYSQSVNLSKCIAFKKPDQLYRKVMEFRK